MKIFLDTSSLIKLYHYEIGTDNLDKFFDDYNIDEIFLSDLAKVEFNSALLKKARTKDITENEANDIIELFKADYDKFKFMNIDSELVLLARDLLTKYGFNGLRTLDSLQLASIIKVKNKLSFALTSDNILKELIKSEGIKTI
jgi:predicted nucleic acid-binding protein